MYKLPTAIFVISMALTGPVMAGSNINSINAADGSFVQVIKTDTNDNAVRKSDRQKCLDMLLPQDGADCLKKLKAKKK